MFVYITPADDGALVDADVPNTTLGIVVVSVCSAETVRFRATHKITTTIATKPIIAPTIPPIKAALLSGEDCEAGKSATRSVVFSNVTLEDVNTADQLDDCMVVAGVFSCVAALVMVVIFDVIRGHVREVQLQIVCADAQS